jgi:hypothetical protein
MCEPIEAGEIAEASQDNILPAQMARRAEIALFGLICRSTFAN